MAVIEAVKTLPVLELRSGLKDVRRPPELMYAYIVLSLLVGDPHRGGQGTALGSCEPSR